jgi:hypothetical protein
MSLLKKKKGLKQGKDGSLRTRIQDIKFAGPWTWASQVKNTF